jgi:hypothetical protein
MGAVNINNTGSGASVALSSDGTSLLLNGTAIGGGSSTLVFNNQTAAYTVVSGDAGKIINCTSGTFTVSLTAAATLGSGFNCVIWNTSTSNTNVITVDPNGAETIDGYTTRILRRGEGMQIVCNGTNWETGNKKTMRGYAENLDVGTAFPIATGDYSIAIMSGSTASGSASVAIGVGATASSTASMALGRNSANAGSQAVTGAGAMALGGSYASGTNSFAAGIGNNTSTYGSTAASSVAIGTFSKASGQESVAIGRIVTASGTNGNYVFGQNSTASGAYSSYAIGANCTSNASFSFSLGYYAISAIIGKLTYANGLFASDGDAQTGTFIPRAATTNATATVLTTDQNAASSNNQVILPNNSAYAFTGTVVARRQAAGGTESAAWKVEGLIRREANAGTTTLVASTVTAISNVPAWTLALSADTTNGGLAVTATGAAATNIRWVATIQTSECTYA